MRTDLSRGERVAALAERVEQAGNLPPLGLAALDVDIRCALHPEWEAWRHPQDPGIFMHPQNGRTHCSPYTSSLDDAVTLFPVEPDMVPSAPHRCAALALRHCAYLLNGGTLEHRGHHVGVHIPANGSIQLLILRDGIELLRSKDDVYVDLADLVRVGNEVIDDWFNQAEAKDGQGS